MAAEQLTRLGADVEAEPAVGQVVVGCHLRLRILGEFVRGHNVRREDDRERQWIVAANLLRHLPTDQDGVGLAAQILQHAELVLHLGAARDEHEGVLHVAQQLPELGQLALEQEAGIRREEVGDGFGRGVRTVC